MNFSGANPKWLLVGFGLVIGSMVLSWVAAIVLGGFKFGSLERRVAHQIAREEYAAFWERMCQRLLQLGFTSGPQQGIFLQGGSEFGNMSSFTHAKTKKELRATAYDNGAGVTVELSLRYLDPIVGDSGETAYRDNVLDFVSGNIAEMRVVPNRSFGAVNSFIGGSVACVSLVIMNLIGFQPILPAICMVAITYMVMAIIAIVAIRSKPGELTGLWLAIAGIGLGLLAIIGAVGLQARAAF
ncbi:MAG: hypothetical protein AAB370_08765 [Verrucomicrobiota bacterium]